MQLRTYATTRLTGVTIVPALRPLVFVVDDDAWVRQSVELLIGAEGWQAVSFESAKAFLAHQRTTVPSCLVLKADLPKSSGLDLQRQLFGQTRMPIIVMTGLGDVVTSVQAMKAGAFDVLETPLDQGVLLSAIRNALEQSNAIQFEESELDALRSRYASLTRREREVMGLVVAGLLNKQIGGELGISEITVKAHRGQVTRKMAAGSVPGLVTMAAHLGVLSLKTH